MNERLCSWIEVTAWKMLTRRPMIRPSSRTGPAILSASIIAWVARLITVSWFMVLGVGGGKPLVEAQDQGVGDQIPPVDQDEQQDLERQGYEARRQHDHPHAHQGRADDQVYEQERQEDQEPDLEGRLELAHDEGGDQDVGRDLSARLRLRLELGQADEQRQVLGAGLLEHELAQRLLPALERLGGGDLLVDQRLVGVLLDRADRRGHDEQGQEQRDAHQHLVGRGVLGAQGLADEAQDDQDPGEPGDREQDRRDDRQAADQQEDL